MSRSSITLQPAPEQVQAWRDAAGDTPLETWLAELADAAAARAAEPPWPRVVKLQYPIDYGTERITTIEMRRGKLSDMKGLKLDKPLPVDTITAVASRLSSVPIKAIEALDIDDAGHVMEAALDFLGRCLTAGMTRSQ